MKVVVLDELCTSLIIIPMLAIVIAVMHRKKLLAMHFVVNFLNCLSFQRFKNGEYSIGQEETKCQNCW